MALIFATISNSSALSDAGSLFGSSIGMFFSLFLFYLIYLNLKDLLVNIIPVLPSQPLKLCIDCVIYISYT
jgi:hypothetical protein